ncbi:DUF3558 domain-containing protein [Pseudonocardia eucalypti]|uniref:DUF3558 domain-containing protein n=1 Tax=Pseudonocardia eucalypti TaxID=648755 RepID=UPI0031EBCE67
MVLALLALVVVGCGSVPSAKPHSGSAGATPVQASRPREVRVDQLDPCTLANRDALAQLGVGDQQRRIDANAANPGQVACAWSNPLGDPQTIALTIATVSNRPISYYLRSVGARPTRIAGFAAADTVGTFNDPEHECIVAIDVAEGQSLLVMVSNDLGDLPGVSHAMLCEKAHVAAEDVMRRLLARTG